MREAEWHFDGQLKAWLIVYTIFRLNCQINLARTGATSLAAGKFGGPERDIPRTWDRLIDNLTALNAQGLLPDLSVVVGLQEKNTSDEISLEE